MSRRAGMPRSLAALTIDPVLGPSRTSCSRSRSLATSAATSNGRSWRRGQEQLAADFQGAAGERLLLVLDDDLVNALLARRAGPAVADAGAGQAHQLEGDVFEDVGRVGAAAEPLEEPAADPFAATVLDHRGQPRLEAVVEAGLLVGGTILVGPELDPCLQHGEIGPDVRSAESQDLAEFHECTRLQDGYSPIHARTGGTTPPTESDTGARSSRRAVASQRLSKPRSEVRRLKGGCRRRRSLAPISTRKTPNFANWRSAFLELPSTVPRRRNDARRRREPARTRGISTLPSCRGSLGWQGSSRIISFRAAAIAILRARTRMSDNPHWIVPPKWLAAQERTQTLRPNCYGDLHPRGMLTRRLLLASALGPLPHACRSHSFLRRTRKNPRFSRWIELVGIGPTSYDGGSQV